MLNYEEPNDIVIIFGKAEKMVIGKPEDIPIELMTASAAATYGEWHIEKAIREAENGFPGVYFDLGTFHRYGYREI